MLASWLRLGWLAGVYLSNARSLSSVLVDSGHMGGMKGCWNPLVRLKSLSFFWRSRGRRMEVLVLTFST